MPNVEYMAEDDTDQAAESVDADDNRPVPMDVNVNDSFAWFPETQDLSTEHRCGHKRPTYWDRHYRSNSSKRLHSIPHHLLHMWK